MQQLLSEGATSNQPKEPIKDEWTYEARALMIAASQQIEEDPKLAARIAEQIFSLGMIDWPSFLSSLAKKDAAEAERLAKIYMNLVRESSLHPFELSNFSRYALAPETSPAIKEYYFQSFAIRLRRGLRPDLNERELQGCLRAARDMI